MKAVDYVTLTLTAALGGSVLGSILAAVSSGSVAAAPVIFFVSLPFTVAGAALLTGVGHLLRAGLTRDLSTFFPIFIVALLVGPLLMALTIGTDLEAAVMGGMFALFTAAAWTALYINVIAPDPEDTDDDAVDHA